MALGLRGIVIGVCGLNGCGKSTVCDFFVSHGFQCISLSDVIRDALRAVGKETTRENMIVMGNALRDEDGPGTLGKRTADKLDLVSTNYVIDSIRHPAEVAALRSKVPLFKLVAVATSPETRFRRLQSRARAGDVRTFEEFERADALESANPNPNGQQLTATMALADYTLENEAGVDELRAAVEALGLHRQAQQ